MHLKRSGAHRWNDLTPSGRMRLKAAEAQNARYLSALRKQRNSETKSLPKLPTDETSLRTTVQKIATLMDYAHEQKPRHSRYVFKAFAKRSQSSLEDRIANKSQSICTFETLLRTENIKSGLSSFMLQNNQRLPAS